jgi:hypothetical protein
MGPSCGNFPVQNKAAARGVLTRWSLVAGSALQELAVASFFSALKRPAVACSGGLPSKARGGAAPEDSDCASRPGGGAAWRRWALGNESGNGEKCRGGYLDGPYIRGQDQGGAKGGGLRS